MFMKVCNLCKKKMVKLEKWVFRLSSILSQSTWRKQAFDTLRKVGSWNKNPLFYTNSFSSKKSRSETHFWGFTRVCVCVSVYEYVCVVVCMRMSLCVFEFSIFFYRLMTCRFDENLFLRRRLCCSKWKIISTPRYAGKQSIYFFCRNKNMKYFVKMGSTSWKCHYKGIVIKIFG